MDPTSTGTPKGWGGDHAASPVRGGVPSPMDVCTSRVLTFGGLLWWNVVLDQGADQFLFEMRSRIEVAGRERCGAVVLLHENVVGRCCTQQRRLRSAPAQEAIAIEV